MRLIRLALASLLLFSPVCWTSEFVGSENCRSCHADAFEQWRGSHHDLAMQKPTPETVLGDFDDATFEYNGVISRFWRRDEAFVVTTDGPDGELTDYEVAYVFGVDPLQQYLLPLPGGRLQALSIAWDSRPASAGGQRWYHLYPDEPINHDDPLHWTGPYQNWNTRCAECHSTNVRKQYSARTHTFDTVFDEIDVGCEACHGPGADHLRMAKAQDWADSVHKGFAMDLAQRGEWMIAKDDPRGIAQRTQQLESRTQVDSCARCHARRGTLGDYAHGKPFAETHRLSLPRSPLYYDDGQILDEVYVYGSFLQSKMQHAGVVCSNCHEPHSSRLRATGNGVCAQCHAPAVYDTQAHHHHPVDSAGALCADCHMPETTYMGVDARRDHGMRVPRPDLSLMLDTPNACTMCHADRNDNWALSALREWGVRFTDTGTHPARAFAAARKGDRRAVPTLTALAADESQPIIWRATATEALGDLGAAEAYANAQALLASQDEMLRLSAVNALSALPLQQRFGLLQPLFKDPVTGVRMAVANQLSAVPLNQLQMADAEALDTLFAEYESVTRRHADMPGMQVQLGLFLAARGDLPGAEAAYREALRLNPQLLPAQLNLADLLRASGRDAQARIVLQGALQTAPDNGAALHALGLLESRQGNTTQALDLLGRAAAAETAGTRHRFVYAIALHDNGDPEAALKQLRTLHRAAPRDTDVLLALVNYNAELGRRDEALRYARSLVQADPRNPAFAQLLRQLGG